MVARAADRKIAPWFGRWMGQGRPNGLDNLHRGFGHMAGLMKKAQLISGSRPNSGENGRIEARPIGDHFRGLNACCSQMG